MVAVVSLAFSHGDSMALYLLMLKRQSTSRTAP